MLFDNLGSLGGKKRSLYGGVCIGILPGQYYDGETGLHYNYHRYYDPQTGRYLKPDPIGLMGDSNLFAYVKNNPINRIDPLGLITAVITVYDYGIGSHSAVYVSENGYGDPAIYDPAGSYGHRGLIGSGDLITGDVPGGGASINDYIQFHENNGSTVSVVLFNTTVEEQRAIYDQADEQGGGAPFTCATKVSEAIDGTGPFQDLGIYSWPGSLHDAVQKIQEQLFLENPCE